MSHFEEFLQDNEAPEVEEIDNLIKRLDEGKVAQNENLPQNTGYLIIFDEPDRSKILLEHIGHRREFSEALSVADWKIKQHEICILSLDGKNLTHVTIAEKGKRVASYKYKIKFKHINSFKPISINLITERMGNRLRRHFINASSGVGGRIPPKTWNEFKSVIKSVSPDVFNKIENLQKLKFQADINYERKTSEILAQEKDAIGLALSISGINRSNILPYWTSNEKYEKVAPFLKGIQSTELLEDQIIIQDCRNFGDWEYIKNLPIMAAVEFRKNGEKLTILNTNRTSIEKTLGIDLIYYHHTYDSFVLVQYKRMTSASDENSGYIYRPTDKSYEVEIRRMEEFEAKYLNSKIEHNEKGFRLHEMPFFFKICSPLTLNPLSSDMIPGMYFPLTYWRILLNSEMVKGPRGGINISYKTVERWFNNSNFIELVQKGWIGSTPGISKYITETIHKLIELDHSVTFAFSSDI